jgi:A/G-specific adenine glycosylase
MLQQTRVEAVIPYYERFLQRFPSIEALAAAAENDVLTAWSGLGYYSRARHLHRAAKQIAARGLPPTHEEILSLPGVGPYTAAAIGSIALGLPHAAVDGNVMRVISRLTNDASEIGSPTARKRFSERAKALLDRRRPGDFNQAMMELGAMVCVPRVPDCGDCPVAKFCAARASGTERELPVKLKKAEARDVSLDLAVIERKECILLIKRDSTQRRLADFWELPEIRFFPRMPGPPPAAKVGEFSHRIVNDRFRVAVWKAPAKWKAPANFRGAKVPKNLRGAEWVPIAELARMPLTTITRKALRAMGSAALR